MNKYQIALQEIKDLTSIVAVKHLSDNTLKTIAELVERATPKMVIQKKFNEAQPWYCADLYIERNACPHCKNKIIHKSNYCPICGQAIM